MIVGSALVEAMEHGEDPQAWLAGLRAVRGERSAAKPITETESPHALGIAAAGRLSMISPLSIDTFLPSFPAIAREFHLSDWQVQQIITAYLLPFACFTLVHGPLSDALGRRPVVIGGLVLYALRLDRLRPRADLRIAAVFRVLQGMSAGVGHGRRRAPSCATCTTGRMRSVS